MTSDEIRKKMRKAFPSLKKPLFSENIFCFDLEYYLPDYNEIESLNTQVWSEIENEKLIYINKVSDCDDFSAIVLGRFKERIMKIARDSKQIILPYPFCELSGTVNNMPHSFNGFICNRGVFISDYGQIKNNIDNYKPVWGRF